MRPLELVALLVGIALVVAWAIGLRLLVVDCDARGGRLVQAQPGYACVREVPR